MLRLFGICHANHFLPDFFEKATEAKKLRDELNGGESIGPYCVARGPDHWRGASGNRKSHNQPKGMGGGRKAKK